MNVSVFLLDSSEASKESRVMGFLEDFDRSEVLGIVEPNVHDLILGRALALVAEFVAREDPRSLVNRLLVADSGDPAKGSVVPIFHEKRKRVGPSGDKGSSLVSFPVRLSGLFCRNDHPIADQGLFCGGQYRNKEQFQYQSGTNRYHSHTAFHGELLCSGGASFKSACSRFGNRAARGGRAHLKSGMNLAHAGTGRNNKVKSSPREAFLLEAALRKAMHSVYDPEDRLDFFHPWGCMPGPSPSSPGLIPHRDHSVGQ